MKLAATLLAALVVCAFSANAARQIVIVTGAGGEPAYTTEFRRQAAAWENAATDEGFEVTTIADDEKSRASLESTLRSLPHDGDDLWIVLLGHGTFDGRNAKFNLAGDDLSAGDLGSWLKSFNRRVVVLALFSASGTFVPELSGPNRIILAATRSGGERNYARLGEKFPDSLASETADLDGDGHASLLELALHATDAVTRLYEDDQRVLSEHAILDDNGDGLGTEVRQLRKNPADTRDGREAGGVTFAAGGSGPAFTPEELAERSRIEAAISDLRTRKGDLEEEVYYRQLEGLLLEMAALYQAARQHP